MTQKEGKRSEFIVAEGEQGLRMDVFLSQKDSDPLALPGQAPHRRRGCNR